MSILDQAEGFVMYDRSSGLFMNSQNCLSKIPRIWRKLSSVKASLKRLVISPYDYRTREFKEYEIRSPLADKKLEVWDLAKNEQCLDASLFLLEEVEFRNNQRMLQPG